MKDKEAFKRLGLLIGELADLGLEIKFSIVDINEMYLCLTVGYATEEAMWSHANKVGDVDDLIKSFRLWLENDGRQKIQYWKDRKINGLTHLMDEDDEDDL